MSDKIKNFLFHEPEAAQCIREFVYGTLFMKF